METEKINDIANSITNLSEIVLKELEIGGEITRGKEAKMVKENTDLDIESNTVKEVDIEKYVESKLNSAFEDDGKDTIEIRQITLRMAKMWEGKGHIYEAIDLFKRILKEYAGTAEAKEAKKALTKHAEKFESEGHHHQAHALYNDIFL